MSSWKNVQYKDGKMRTSEGGGGGGSSTFAGLDDVDFSNLANGQIPKYNSTTQKWENANESGGGGTVTDVEVDGQSVVNSQGVAEITMPTPPAIPVVDVKVNGASVVDDNKEAQITSYKEVTQSQYDALPSSKLTDGVAYFIKDSASAESYPPLIYSFQEREIGVWADGKPLYQRTFDFGSNVGISNTNWTATPVQKAGIGFVVACICSDSSGHASWGDMSISLDADNTYISLLCMRNGDNSNVRYMTLQYTKTSDTAGSGIWAGNGAIAHHYSTDETVVGTWIDGKPIYERTYANLSVVLSSGTYIHSGITISTVDKIISCVSAIDTDGQTVILSIGLYSTKELALYCYTVGTTLEYLTVQYTKTTD